MTVWINRDDALQPTPQRLQMTKAYDAEVEKDVDAVVSSLRVLLANTISFYLRAHGFHWNVKGPDFAQYHRLFGDIYEDVYESVDDIAENILKLNGMAPFRLPELMALRSIVDQSVATPLPSDMTADLLNGNDAMLLSLRSTFEVATVANEQGIADFVAGRIDQHQKWGWQLRASLA